MFNWRAKDDRVPWWSPADVDERPVTDVMLGQGLKPVLNLPYTPHKYARLVLSKGTVSAEFCAPLHVNFQAMEIDGRSAAIQGGCSPVAKVQGSK